MKSCFRIRTYLKKLITNLLAANKNNLSNYISYSDSTVIDDVDFIINSSIIIHYVKDGKDVYFRECQQHLPLYKHINNAIEDYCFNVTHSNNPKSLLELIKFDLSFKDNLKRYVNIPNIFDSNLIKILSGEYDDFASVGLPSFEKLKDKNEFLQFIKYSCCVLLLHSNNSYLDIGSYENSNANKQLATYILSKLLRLDELIPRVEIVKLNIAGKVRIGTLMEKAEGSSVAYMHPYKRKEIVSSNFLRTLTNLEYFDSLCYQLDHRLDNYNVVFDENGLATAVVAFDNDASRTFFPVPKLPSKTYAGASSVIRNRKLNRPYVDKVLYQRLCEITERDLMKTLSLYLTKIQLKTLWIRICKLRTAITKAKEMNPCIIVEPEKWKEIDATKELDSQYGVTYYNLYLHDTTLLDRENFLM